MCVQNLLENKNVSQSLVLLSQITGTYPAQGHHDSIASIIESLQKNYQLLDLFFNDLIRFQTEGLPFIPSDIDPKRALIVSI